MMFSMDTVTVPIRFTDFCLNQPVRSGVRMSFVSCISNLVSLLTTSIMGHMGGFPSPSSSNMKRGTLADFIYLFKQDLSKSTGILLTPESFCTKPLNAAPFIDVTHPLLILSATGSFLVCMSVSACIQMCTRILTHFHVSCTVKILENRS